jgi:hypothetical protein
MLKRGSAEWPGVAEEDGGTRWETKLTCRARMVVTGGRKDVTAEMRNPKETRPSCEYGKAARAEWARRGRRWLVGQVGRCGQTRPTRSDPRRRFKGKIDFQISNELGFCQDFEKIYKEI